MRLKLLSLIINLMAYAFIHPQIQEKANSTSEYDLFIVAELGGLQFRKYLIKFSSCPGSTRCGMTYTAKLVKFGRRNINQWRRTGRKLLPIFSDCHKLLFDQETNLLHSITDR